MIENTKDKVIDLLNQWKIQLEKKSKHGGIYLFGSLVNRKGLTFNKEKSDVDLMVIIPEEIVNDFIKRRDWIEAISELKISLEQKLQSILERSDSGTQIVSLLPVTLFEIRCDIHKSNARPFFKITNFIEIGSNKVVKGEDLVKYSEFEDDFLRQVFCAVQKSRNEFLTSSPIGNIERLTHEKVGELPKSLCREAGKINSYSITDIQDTGDLLSVPFGFDLLKNELRLRIDMSPEFEFIYNWTSSSANESTKLTENNILLLYELLFEKALEIFNSSAQRTGFAMYEISIQEEFAKRLNSTDLLEKSHSKDKILQLNDVLVDPKLESYDDSREYNTSIDSIEFYNNFIGYGNVLVAGEGQSGKTVFCRQLFKHLVEQNYIPIYLNDRKSGYAGNFQTMLKSAFDEQLVLSENYEELNLDRIVPIVDDFHLAKDKNKLIKALKEYPHHLIVVDDVFELNFSNELLIKSYDHFKIEEFSPVLRFELVEKWVDLTIKKEGGTIDENERLERIDSFCEVVDSILGKVFGVGIMPAYPFFILSIISTYEAANSSNKQITSQGHCYYALIYLYLINDGVKDEHFDTYLNFLTEFSFFLYDSETEEVAPDKFQEFLTWYDETYNLSISIEEIMQHLSATNIVKQNTIGNYEFCYTYLYFYFVGKYFAENFDDEGEEITEILTNLHNNDFAYIVVFISHHAKNEKLLTQLNEISDELFKSFDEATLTKEELGFFDEQIELIAAAVLPSASNLPIAERKKRLEEKDKLEKAKEESLEQLEDGLTFDEKADELALEMRRSIKTVEVMGQIIKNRSGSLKKAELKTVFEKGMNIHLRILKSFIELISNPENQIEVVDFISKKIDYLIEEKGIDPNERDIPKLAKEIFWNANFYVMYGFIQKIINSLGSKKLLNITDEVCDAKNTPSAELVRHGILMWYGKNLQIDNIRNAIQDPTFSKTAVSAMKYQIVNHSKMHKIGYKKLQKLETELNMSSKRLISEHMKANRKN